MLIDGFQLLEQSSITNLVVSNGDTFPTAPTNIPDIGELFYKTLAEVGFPIGLYVYDGTDWQELIVNSSLGTTTIDSGTTFPVSPADGELFYKSSSDINGELGLYVYTLSDTSWHITASSTTLTNHISDASVHLTSGQNTLLDNITVSSSEINYLSGVSSNVQTQISDKLSKTGGTMTGNIIVSTGSHISVADAPTSGTDVVNKNYVDSNMAGLTWKNSVKAATTANITLSGTQTIDGIAVIAGDRVLVKAQSTASQNGIYVVGSGTWVRATDMDATTPINELNSAAVFVEQGTLFADTGWTQINLINTLETDDVAFTQFNGAANISAGIGLDKSGNELYVKLGAGVSQLPTDEIGVDVYATGGLMTTVDGDTTSTLTGAQLSLTKVGTAGTYKSVTTDAYGRVTSGTNPTTLAGYGITDAQALDADLTAIAALSGTTGFLKKTAADTWALDTTTYLTGNQSITLSGDITGSGTTAITATLATVGIEKGGTGETTANAAFNALAPSQSTNSGKYLTTDGTNTSWATVTAGGDVYLANTQTFSGVNTFSQDIKVPGIDTAGGQVVSFIDTASAVNYMTMKGAASSFTPSIQSAGSDANVGLVLVSKGTGVISLKPGNQNGLNIANVTSGVNYLTITNGATGLAPNISTTGSDANIGLYLYTKGSGSYIFYTNGANRQVQIRHVASAVNYLDFQGAASGTGPNISVFGTDANIDLNLTPKGTGVVKINAAGGIKFSDNTVMTTAPTGGGTITISGDITGSGTTSIATTLADSGVTAGTYKSVTVDAKGRVTAGTNPTTLAGYGITDAAPSSHVSDATVHLTSAQNTWIDGITATSAEVNYLSGVTSAIQTQLGNKQPLDADLTAIAALAGTSGFLKKTAADTWALDTSTYLTAHPTISGATSVNNSGLTYIQDLTFDSNGHVTGQVSAAIQSASTSQQGVVQLSDSTSTTSSTVAATSTAVKSAYDLANAALPKSGGTMSGNIIIPTGSHITLTDAPVNGTDAVNKNYIDANLAGLSWKNSVKAATTANITLSGAQTIDGVSLVANDRVLVKDQTASSANGIYVVAASAWTRALDMDATTPINELNSAAVFVEQGTVNADSGWTQINNISALGTDAIVFTQFNGAAGITPGIGLSKTGNQLDVNLGAGIAQLPTDEIGVDVYATGGLMTTVDGTASSTLTGAQLSLTKVGIAGTYKSVTTDAYGRVTAGTNPTTLSGYGITDAQALDADLTAIAALAGTTGFLKKTAANTWTLDTSAYLTGNQSITVSGDASGSGTTAISLTLATITDSGTGTFKKLTTNTKGLVTGTTAVTQSDITGLLGAGSITNTMLANSAVANLSGTNTGDQTITLTGDVTGSGTGSFATTLANTAVTAGSYGSATTASTFTVDGKGRLTAAGSTTITPAWSSITSKPTTLSGYGITDAAPSSHVSDETVHLTSAQNTWIDGITATSAEVNYLSGVTSNIQTQLGNKQPLDADLTAIAALTGTVGFLKTNGAGTWTAETTIPGSSVSGELDGGTF